MSLILAGLIFIMAPPVVADPAVDLALAAEARATHQVRYDPSYRKIAYPMGDVPADTGVCTDVVIRAYRVLGIDLQVLVHEDMRGAFSRYPKTWGHKSTDRNIDHRRVPNLEVFFTRNGQSLPVSDDSQDYLPGDIVSWRLPNGAPHIGIVTTQAGTDGTPLIAHNIGWGPKIENMLFLFPIEGHFRFMKTAN